jgi:hypothetical protein
VLFSVHFSASLDVPAEVRVRAHEVLLDVAESLADIPESSAFWSVMNDGNAELNLGRWRLEYRVDRGDRRILVTDAQQIGERTA